MEYISEIVLGGAVGEAVLEKKIGNKATGWGAIAVTIPYLDIIPAQFMDVVSRIEFHRSVTHSFLFALLMSPLLGWLVHRIHRSDAASKWQWIKLCFWGLFTHALLDCCTTWGTQLFWPFSEYRIAWKNVAVVDPLYTVPFLILLVAVMFRPRDYRSRRVLNWLGLGVSTAYLCLGFINQQVMKSAFERELSVQKISYARLSMIPTLFNNVLWRGVAETDSAFYIGYASFLDPEIKPKFTAFRKNHALIRSLPHDARLQKFQSITDGYFIMRKNDHTLTLSDLRFDQAGGWISPDAPFIFNYELTVEEKGGLMITRSRPPISATDGKRFIHSLARRISGNIPAGLPDAGQ